MSETEREIADQPSCWRRATEMVETATPLLPRAGERAAVVGCGTSWFMAQAYAARREAAGLGETDAFTASEFPTGRAYARVVAISRSGTTTEVTRLLERLRGNRTPATAITAVRGTPVPTASEDALVLGFADERSVVQTRFATTTLALLRASLGEDLGPAIADAERARDESLPVDPAQIDHVAVLGHGWTVGLANEGALKLREAAQVHTESYPAMEYRHGPISLAGAGSLVWILGSPDPSVADAARDTGAVVREATLDPMAELVMIQRLAVAMAAIRGLDPDTPRNLTRSVVLS